MASPDFETHGNDSEQGHPNMSAGEGKTSLPDLNIFDPSVFDMRMLLTVVAVVGLATLIVYKWWLRRGKEEDTFFEDLGISFSRFEFPNEVDDYNIMKANCKGGLDDKKTLKSALMKRAIADIPIILRMQNEGQGMHNMYQQAMIGNKEWKAFQQTEEAVSREIELVQNEAETFQVGFGSQIWQMAMQLRSAIMEKQSEMEKGEKRREAEETNRNDGEESKSTGKQPEIIPLSKTTAPQKIGPSPHSVGGYYSFVMMQRADCTEKQQQPFVYY
eukprot:8062_1